MENSQRHRMEDCPLPNYLRKCSDCLITSFNGSDHTPSCSKPDPITSIDMDIYAQKPLPLFKLKFDDADDKILAFNQTTGAFDEFQEKTLIQAAEVDCTFAIHTADTKKVIDIDASTLNRFSVAVAFFISGFWRIRYRFVVTITDGVLCFPLRSTMEKHNGIVTLPKNCSLNTALVIGVMSSKDESTVKVRVHAGTATKQVYHGYVTYNAFYDKINISDNLVARKTYDTRRFERKLYASQPAQSENVQWLQVDNSSCANCRHNMDIKTNFRTNVYSKFPLPMFKIAIENSNDAVYLLDKETGSFELIKNFVVLHAHKINGVFQIADNCISFNGTSRKKTFEILVAYHTNGSFLLKYGVMARASGASAQIPQHNLEMSDTNVYKVPLNTGIVIGIIPAGDTSAVTFGMCEKVTKVTWRNDNSVGIIDPETDQSNEFYLRGEINDNANVPSVEEPGPTPPNDLRDDDDIDFNQSNNIFVDGESNDNASGPSKKEFDERLGQDIQPIQFVASEFKSDTLENPKHLALATMPTQEFGAWERYTRGIGRDLLLRMGFQQGKGLGKDLQGIAFPLQARQHKGRAAIGAYGGSGQAIEYDKTSQPKVDEVDQADDRQHKGRAAIGAYGGSGQAIEYDKTNQPKVDEVDQADLAKIKQTLFDCLTYNEIQDLAMDFMIFLAINYKNDN